MIKSNLQKLLNRVNGTKHVEDADLGLSTSYAASGNQRVLNEDGSYNVTRKGTESHFYHELITSSWPRFFLFALFCYTLVAGSFAIIYFFIGVQYISPAPVSDSYLDQFLLAFYFSTQTMTTVGYGTLVPTNNLTNIVSSFESMLGLLVFAIGSGMVYARFSKPVSSIIFSDLATICEQPSGDVLLKIRVANGKKNSIMEVEARMVLTWLEPYGDRFKRKYEELKLEQNQVYSLPLNWTIAHHITEASPLYSVDEEWFKEKRGEVLLFIKAFNDSYSQVVHDRKSFTLSQIRFNQDFDVPYTFNKRGKTVFNIKDLSHLK